MKIKENRLASFLIVLAVYLVAGVIGYFTYTLAPIEQFYLKLLVADVFGTIVVFIFSLIFKNASVYDPYWSVLPVVVMLFYATESAFTPVTVAFVFVIALWGVRLTLNWAYTFKGLKYQDWRYTMLKEKTGALYPLVNFFGIHLFPTLVVYACILPAVFAFKTSITALNAGFIVFFTVSVLAVVLQGVSDYQMHTYRKNKTQPFINVGLWKYARHPNYLGEILMWWGVGLAFVCLNPSAWYLLTGALVNTLMFVFISVPLADGRQSKKDGFAEYKNQTRIFLPIKK